MPWVKKGARKCMGCGKKTDPIDTATNLATLENGGHALAADGGRPGKCGLDGGPVRRCRRP